MVMAPSVPLVSQSETESKPKAGASICVSRQSREPYIDYSPARIPHWYSDHCGTSRRFGFRRKPELASTVHAVTSPVHRPWHEAGRHRGVAYHTFPFANPTE